MSLQTILVLVLVGIASGMLSGLVGVGGGLIIVPSLIYFLGFSQHAAQGTSLGLLLLPAGILGVMEYYKQGDVNLNVVWVLAVGFLAGNYFGSKVALNISQETLRKYFAVFMLLIAVKMLFFDKKTNNKKVVVELNSKPIEKS